MRREITNKIRYILEDIIPPALRDSFIMRWIMARYQNGLVLRYAEFRKKAHLNNTEEYRKIYEDYEPIHDSTDNSEAVLQAIAEHCEAGGIADIGCGGGYLLNYLQNIPELNSSKFTGVEYVVTDELKQKYPNISFQQAAVENLPFADKSFDTVICTHVLEHVLDLRAAIAELRRICSKRLIIVVPREREGRYTFNPHLHFFAYKESFLRQMIPLEKPYQCFDLDRDIFYTETVE